MTSNDTGPRAGTIIWAAVLLVFAAAAFCFAVLDVRELPAFSIVWIITGLGAVLVIGAIIALVIRAGSQSVRTPVVEPVETPAAATVETPAKKPRAKKDQPVD